MIKVALLIRRRAISKVAELAPVRWATGAPVAQPPAPLVYAATATLSANARSRAWSAVSSQTNSSPRRASAGMSS